MTNCDLLLVGGFAPLTNRDSLCQDKYDAEHSGYIKAADAEAFAKDMVASGWKDWAPSERDCSFLCSTFARHLHCACLGVPGYC